MKLVDDFDMYVAGGHNCYLCGSDRHEGEPSVIDLDRDIDMEGALMICMACGIDIAHLLDCSSPSQTARYQGQIRNQADEISALKARLAAFEDRILEAIQ